MSDDTVSVTPQDGFPLFPTPGDFVQSIGGVGKITWCKKVAQRFASSTLLTEVFVSDDLVALLHTMDQASFP